MARTGVSYEQVASVADALFGEGQQPGIRIVRERLGDTGSPNTIQRHLSKWRDSRPVKPTVAQELPQELVSAIAAVLDRAASTARGEVEARLAESQKEAHELAVAGESIEGERDELADEVVALTQQRDTLSGRASQLDADLSEAHRRIEREQHAAESARVDLAKTMLKVESQAERIHDQAADILKLRSDLSQAQDARVTAERNAAVLSAKLESVTEKNTAAEQKILKLESQIVELSMAHEKRVAQLEGRLEKSAEAMNELRSASAAELKELRVQWDESVKVAAELKEQFALLSGRMEKDISMTTGDQSKT